MAVDARYVHHTNPPQRFDWDDSAAALNCTFAHLVVRLPSCSDAGAVVVTQGDQHITRVDHMDAFGVTYSVVYTDLFCTLECAGGGYALFAVYSLRFADVRTQPGVCILCMRCPLSEM